jgi:hypothetical protein
MPAWISELGMTGAHSWAEAAGTAIAAASASARETTAAARPEEALMFVSSPLLAGQAPVRASIRHGHRDY